MKLKIIILGLYWSVISLVQIVWSHSHPQFSKFAQKLVRNLDGEVFAKGSIGYEKRRLIHNGLCTHIYPDWIVVPANTEDVALVIRLTNKYKIPISVRSGGHSFTCSSIKKGKLPKFLNPDAYCIIIQPHI